MLLRSLNEGKYLIKEEDERRDRRKTSMRGEQREWSGCFHSQANLWMCARVWECRGADDAGEAALVQVTQGEMSHVRLVWVAPPARVQKQPLIMQPWKHTNCLSRSLVHARTHTNTRGWSSQTQANTVRYLISLLLFPEYDGEICASTKHRHFCPSITVW